MSSFYSYNEVRTKSIRHAPLLKAEIGVQKSP